MKITITRLSTQGRVTIPTEFRIEHKLKPGTRIAFIEKDGKIILLPVNKKYFNEIADMLGLKGKMLNSLIKVKKKKRES